jgi:hypothetical protein
MKVKKLLISSILWAGALTATAQELEFTTSGSCAEYITWNNAKSHQADSVYLVNKTSAAIVIDGVAESAWDGANAAIIKKIAHNMQPGEVLDLSNYPQSETDLKATFRALWTDNGMYMFIDVVDDLVRYQVPEYQWENDGIEFYFAKAVGEGKIQVIIPAMVGTAAPGHTTLDFESGSAAGSDPLYKVFGFDANNWDETTFKWAIKKTATGYSMEVYMDKDIVTNGNSDTNFGLNKMFAGDINVDEADEKQNTNDPALYVREGSLAMLGNSNQEYASSNYYGWFKMVDDEASGELDFTTTGSCAEYITWNNEKSHQADSVYTIEKTGAAISVDGVAEPAWDEANAVVIKKIAHSIQPGGVLDLSNYPQSETDLKATFRALWTDNGMYMFIDVVDDLVRYQVPEYQWENDGIEFYFAKAVGEGKIQVIIPAMVGTAAPGHTTLDFESGSAAGSDPLYKVFGFDANNWDETTFKWAIKKTATGYSMEVYMDKDIVTNGNSDTNFGLNKMFAGDINVDEADEKQNTNDPALYVREGSLAMLGNSNQEYASSNYYGWFKMVNENISTGIEVTKNSDFVVLYSSANKEITVNSPKSVSATLYNIAGQAMTSRLINGKMSVSGVKSGIYILNVKDTNGNHLGSKKIAIF